MPLDLLKLASCWDAGRMGGTGSLAVQIGGLQMQGAAFDGTRFSELTQVRGLAEGRQLGNGLLTGVQRVPAPLSAPPAPPPPRISLIPPSPLTPAAYTVPHCSSLRMRLSRAPCPR